MGVNRTEGGVSTPSRSPPSQGVGSKFQDLHSRSPYIGSEEPKQHLSPGLSPPDVKATQALHWTKTQKEGPLENKLKKDVSTDPSPLPDGFEWCTIDLENDDDA